MSETVVKEIIHKAAREAKKECIMDEVIIPTEIFDVLSYSESSHYQDVPIKDVISLGETDRDILAKGDTWRTSTYKLHCKSWDQNKAKIFQYFISKQKKRYFPAEGSTNDLHVGYIADVYFCKLGNHRLLAAKAWLNNIIGPNMKIYRVYCTEYTLLPDVKDILKKCIEDSGTIAVCHKTRYLKVKSNKGVTLYHKNNDKDSYKKVYNLADLRTLPQKLKGTLDFREIPIEIVKRLLN
ncbi:hypothetical protein HR060_09190 [Catenovulum sp. SM1970]|uniref:hypothetical protein n=1 Tax=Marinifaba aquimaris TaxID=2741323 RepID=UPI0015723412|nr:hypothetical protein [Marinifaba aquimaris]NTS77046.1 hypothetical protein [Marinifaba aquimaris]